MYVQKDLWLPAKIDLPYTFSWLQNLEKSTYSGFDIVLHEIRYKVNWVDFLCGWPWSLLSPMSSCVLTHIILSIAPWIWVCCAGVSDEPWLLCLRLCWDNGQLSVLWLIRQGPDLSVTIIQVCLLTYDLVQNLRKLLFKSERRHKGGIIQ